MLENEGIPQAGDNADLQQMTNQGLEVRLSLYQPGSAEYERIKQEMTHRGYQFTGANTQQTASANPAQKRVLRYSQGWSVFWEALFFLLGAALFIFLMTEISDEPGAKTIALYALAAVAVWSLGAMVSGVRNLANRKGGAALAIRNGAWQVFLGVVWCLAGAVCLYYAVKLFVEVAKWDLGWAIKGSAIPVVAALVCASFAITLITLGREMGSED